MQNGHSDRRTSTRAYTVKFWQMDIQKEKAATKGATKAAAKAAAKAPEARAEKAATQGYGLKWLRTCCANGYGHDVQMATDMMCKWPRTCCANGYGHDVQMATDMMCRWLRT